MDKGAAEASPARCSSNVDQLDTSDVVLHPNADEPGTLSSWDSNDPLVQAAVEPDLVHLAHPLIWNASVAREAAFHRKFLRLWQESFAVYVRRAPSGRGPVASLEPYSARKLDAEIDELSTLPNGCLDVHQVASVNEQIEAFGPAPRGFRDRLVQRVAADMSFKDSDAEER